MLAMSSHFPYVMASIVAHLTEDNTPLKSVIGTGFKSTTRVASASPYWGSELVLANKKAMKSLINQTKSRLASIEKALDENDKEALFEFFETAKNQRDDLID
jgi:prephenate dehydrogenase